MIVQCFRKILSQVVKILSNRHGFNIWDFVINSHNYVCFTYNYEAWNTNETSICIWKKTKNMKNNIWNLIETSNLSINRFFFFCRTPFPPLRHLHPPPPSPWLSHRPFHQAPVVPPLVPRHLDPLRRDVATQADPCSRTPSRVRQSAPASTIWWDTNALRAFPVVFPCQCTVTHTPRASPPTYPP